MSEHAPCSHTGPDASLGQVVAESSGAAAAELCAQRPRGRVRQWTPRSSAERAPLSDSRHAPAPSRRVDRIEGIIVARRPDRVVKVARLRGMARPAGAAR
jgi:hypothetical protein